MSRDSSISNHLKTLGADVSSIDYEGYENILQNPSLAGPQLGTLTRIASWIDNLGHSPTTGTDCACQSGRSRAANRRTSL